MSEVGGDPKRVLLERAAERDLSRLSSEIHDRVIVAVIAAMIALRQRPWLPTLYP